MDFIVGKSVSKEAWERNDFPVWQYFQKNSSAECLNNWKGVGPEPPQSDSRIQQGLRQIKFGEMVILGSIEILKTDFFSNVSHEIKTPLAVIQNHAYLLQNSKLTEEECKDYTDIILQASKKLSNLITNILKLNKLEKQAIKPMLQTCDLCAQLCDNALQFENIWKEKAIEFNVDIEERVNIAADEGLLDLVWTNLISNAMKFTPAGGTVTLKQVSDKDKVTVSIADTGCGMDE